MQKQVVLRRQGVREVTCLSLPTIYRLIRKGEFPPPFRLSEHAVGWDADEVFRWVERRKAASGRRHGGAQ